MIDVIWDNPMIEGDVKKAVLNSKEMKEANNGKKLEGYPFDLFWKALRKKVKDLDK